MLKCIPLLLLLAFSPLISSAQVTLDKAKSAAQAGGIDVNSAANAILGKLTPALGLSAAQKPNVLTAVTGFLKDKSGIMGLLNTDKAAYTSKLTGLQNGLFGKLKGILSLAQYTKFLGLKPKAADAANVLTQLFY
ncbi:hypothetical protein [uncultured Chitinophaga sp.]|uniref:hypothetical protein n=1 Tax=uncultured Chitinophaga sp. TaxID=339340 RepID=UPI0025EDC950|nr:hypothetical protein [uncultured Chitinophaga sp.]